MTALVEKLNGSALPIEDGNATPWYDRYRNRLHERTRLALSGRRGPLRATGAGIDGDDPFCAGIDYVDESIV